MTIARLDLTLPSICLLNWDGTQLRSNSSRFCSFFSTNFSDKEIRKSTTDSWYAATVYLTNFPTKKLWWKNKHIQYFTRVASKFNVNGILLPKFFWPTVRNKCSSEKNFWNIRLKPRIWKFFEITKTIYVFKQFFKQNAFSTCSWRFLWYNTYMRTIIIQIG